MNAVPPDIFCSRVSSSRLPKYACKEMQSYGKLILRGIMKTVATRCRILKLKCTKFDFGGGSAPDPARGAYSTSPDP